ncbi:MAG TPA: TetR/AcrR family transcriptional regulator [Mycobacteriales bacterium]|nr:TetR/AcrR family transcriptional regulator [Mycobacteriales bacterium]
MTAIRTARDRARAELTQEIKAEARRQLAEHGAHQLSLRAVAKALGMVSSALYRYFPSRDQLLTALIIDAYDALGDAAEAADAGVDRADHRGRWQAACQAVRTWARAHPHEYALIYGSPIPGYRAPQDTVAPATRVALLLVALVQESHAAGTLTAPAADAAPLPPQVAEQTRRLAETIASGLPPLVLARVVLAWTQLFGLISFELFGQFVGSMDPAEPFAAYATDQLADYVGLRAGIPD